MSPHGSSTSERREPCTHTVMTRIYDSTGALACSWCHKRPPLGWLYRCTQDSNGFLPESDFDPMWTMEDRRDTSHGTSPLSGSSTVKDIEGDAYSTEQINTLIMQKEEVKNVIHGPDSRPVTASTSSTSSSTADETFSTLPQSTTFSTASSVSLDEEIRAAYDWKELQKVWMSEPATLAADTPPTLGRPTGASRPLASSDSKGCAFRVCPTCRPTYRERAYLSLNSVLDASVTGPPIWEMENRRVSDARIVAKIGAPRHLRRDGQVEASASASCADTERVALWTNDQIESMDPCPDRASIKRGGFRQAVRKALTRALHDTVPTGHDLGGGSEPHSPTPPPNHSLIARRRKKSRPTLPFVGTQGRVVDTSSLHDSVMLMLATNTPLPHTPTLNSPRITPLVLANSRRAH